MGVLKMFKVGGKVLGLNPIPIIIIIFTIALIKIISIFIKNPSRSVEKKIKEHEKIITKKTKDGNNNNFIFKWQNKGEYNLGNYNGYDFTITENFIICSKGSGQNKKVINLEYKLEGDKISIKYNNIRQSFHDSTRWYEIKNEDNAILTDYNLDRIRLNILQQYLPKAEFTKYIKQEINKEKLLMDELGKSLGEYNIFIKSYENRYNNGDYDEEDTYYMCKYEFVYPRVRELVKTLRKEYNISGYYFGKSGLKLLYSYIEEDE